MDKRFKTFVTIIGVIIFLVVLRYANQREYVENECLRMGTTTYNNIKGVLGNGATDAEIVAYFNNYNK